MGKIENYLKRRYSVMTDYSLDLVTNFLPFAFVYAFIKSKGDCELGVTLFDRKKNKYLFNTKEV